MRSLHLGMSILHFCHAQLVAGLLTTRWTTWRCHAVLGGTLHNTLYTCIVPYTWGIGLCMVCVGAT